MFNISLKICVFIILQKVSAIFDSNSKRLQATNGGKLSNTSANLVGSPQSKNKWARLMDQKMKQIIFPKI